MTDDHFTKEEKQEMAENIILELNETHRLDSRQARKVVSCAYTMLSKIIKEENEDDNV